MIPASQTAAIVAIGRTETYGIGWTVPLAAREIVERGKPPELLELEAHEPAAATLSMRAAAGKVAVNSRASSATLGSAGSSPPDFIHAITAVSLGAARTCCPPAL